MNDEPLWTVKQIAELLQMSTKTVYRWANDGRIPCVRLGQNLRFNPDEIRAWVDADGDTVIPIQHRSPRLPPKPKSGPGSLLQRRGVLPFGR